MLSCCLGSLLQPLVCELLHALFGERVGSNFRPIQAILCFAAIMFGVILSHSHVTTACVNGSISRLAIVTLVAYRRKQYASSEAWVTLKGGSK